MDIVGTSLSAAQTLLAALQSSQLKQILGVIGYQSQLEDLKHTVKTVTAILLDAETKHELSQQAQVLIEQLRDVVYEADDLLDEFVTLAEQKQLLKDGVSLSKRFRHFFSGSNPLGVAYRMSQGVRKIQKKLDAIAYNKQLNFKHDPEPIKNRSRETCSYVNEVDIIGREDDLEQIVGKLLDDSNVQHDVSFLSIVGVGGLGKTALAQLVFNNHRVTSAFPVRIWTCVADQDQKQLDVKDIMGKILGRNRSNSTMEQLQSQLRQRLAGKKFLLVLDDVWTENRTQWCDLAQYLIGGVRGSWIVVTTRSQSTATIIDGKSHNLMGLSENDSWSLFEKTAFASNQRNPLDHELVNIGRDIVDRCARVPLAIKVAGSLVFGQDKGRWLSILKTGFTNVRGNKNDIMSILKLSYHHLESPLKSCFTYCALFPKDFRIKKEMLISLWMSQNYIIPLDYGQSTEDAAEEYFSILLNRCFFQDIEKNDVSEIESCKIHDLMHDIAQSVSRKEIYPLNSTNIGSLNKNNVRHLSVAGTREYGKYPLGITHIRSHLLVDDYIYAYDSRFAVKDLVANCNRLRALDLRSLRVDTLPSSIGELLHLRYLDLSGNFRLVLLPSSITKLCNLQTLLLSGCKELKELPKDLSRLVKLRVLDIESCYKLAYMPSGMDKLSNLERLKGEYKVGEEERCSSWKEWFYGLQDLKTLNNLKGKLVIKIRWPEKAKNKNVGMEEDNCSWNWREGLNSCLRSMEHLHYLTLRLRDYGKISDGAIMEMLMEELQPHYNLKSFHVIGYKGVKMPGWFSNRNSLPHLVSLHLEDFTELEYLPLLPSLECLYLRDLPKLKGVVVEESSSSSSNPVSQQLLLPHLSKLQILNCPELMCIRIMAPVLREVELDRMSWLDSIPVECFKSIQLLSIQGDYEMVGLPNCVKYCSTLQELRMFSCSNLQSIPIWMPKLTSLEVLRLESCSKSLERRCRKDPPGEDWPYIQHIPYFDIF